jgi:hypothetical protein
MSPSSLHRRIESTGFVDSARSYYGSVILEGINQTTIQTLGVPFAFAAVGTLEFKDCNCEATDLLANVALPAPEADDGPPDLVFWCRIRFNNPIDPGQPFRIRVRFRLAAVMLKQNDYDMINLVRFPRGVGTLTMRLLAKRIYGPTFWELRGQRLQRSVSLVQTGDFECDYPAEAGSVRGAEVRIESPSALSYMLRYDAVE